MKVANGCRGDALAGVAVAVGIVYARHGLARGRVFEQPQHTVRPLRGGPARQQRGQRGRAGQVGVAVEGEIAAVCDPAAARSWANWLRSTKVTCGMPGPKSIRYLS